MPKRRIKLTLLSKMILLLCGLACLPGFFWIERRLSTGKGSSPRSALMGFFAGVPSCRARTKVETIRSSSSPAAMVEAFGPVGLARREQHRDVRVTARGAGAERYFLFEPEAPRPRSAPVVLFFHGWAGMNPGDFGAWIDHLVREGNIVIFPVYQDDIDSSPSRVTEAAIGDVRSALAELSRTEHVQPDLKEVAATGYSLGATITANVAARAAAEGLPAIRAMLLATPGNAEHVASGWAARSILGNLSAVPAETMAVVMAADEDTGVGRGTGETIYRQLSRLPAANRDFLVVHSDRHGTPSLTATHASPRAPDARYNFPGTGGDVSLLISSRGPSPSPPDPMVNALDYYGFWKVLDGLLDAVCRGTNRDVALGGGIRQRFMGLWPDGALANELTVESNLLLAQEQIAPSAPPRRVAVLAGDSMIQAGLSLYLAPLMREEGYELICCSRSSSTTQTWYQDGELEDVIRKHDPEVILLCLGSNELFIPAPWMRETEIRGLARLMEGRRRAWIGPPTWKPDRGIVAAIRQYAAPCPFFDSGQLVLPRQRDHIHPDMKGGKAWARAVWDWFKNLPDEPGAGTRLASKQPASASTPK